MHVAISSFPHGAIQLCNLLGKSHHTKNGFLYLKLFLLLDSINSKN